MTKNNLDFAALPLLGNERKPISYQPKDLDDLIKEHQQTVTRLVDYCQNCIPHMEFAKWCIDVLCRLRHVKEDPDSENNADAFIQYIGDAAIDKFQDVDVLVRIVNTWGSDINLTIKSISASLYVYTSDKSDPLTVKDFTAFNAVFAHVVAMGEIIFDYYRTAKRIEFFRDKKKKAA